MERDVRLLVELDLELRVEADSIFGLQTTVHCLLHLCASLSQTGMYTLVLTHLNGPYKELANFAE